MVIDRESWEKIQNDIEMIKARVSSLDRIAVLQNQDSGRPQGDRRQV